MAVAKSQHDQYDHKDSSAKAAHVNMMTDTIIANLPVEGLRGVLRGLLGTNSSNTKDFHDLSLRFLHASAPTETPVFFLEREENLVVKPEFFEFQRRYRCLMGCGCGFESAAALTRVLEQIAALEKVSSMQEDDIMAAIDGDIVQVVTAVQKELTTSAGVRKLTGDEQKIVATLRDMLVKYRTDQGICPSDFVFARGLSRLQREILGITESTPQQRIPIHTEAQKISSIGETVKLGNTEVPRMFMGLWQFSSPAWGTASKAKINAHFQKHVDAGFFAYDMADHYGDAEVTFGQFRATQSKDNNIYCATKLCIFNSMVVNAQTITNLITERVTNIESDRIELLQFHWQNYDDHQYVEAAHLIASDQRVQNIGLCNFDTARMVEIIEANVPIVSNQVQFSLIDLRPTFQMAKACEEHNVKLLTYGSLCGGFLADKWLDKPAPSLFKADMTPSHRKYLEMILVWGTWELFQRLLSTLSDIAKKHSTSTSALTISSVAVRWVLQHPCVGAVIIGARMGISEHVEENKRIFGWQLDEKDLALIEEVLVDCRAKEVFEAMGDCGAEYRV